MAAMAWQTTGDVTEFLAAAGPYLRRERVRNTVILSVTETMRVNAEASAANSSAALVGEPRAAGPRAAGPKAAEPKAAEPEAVAVGQPPGPAARPLLGWWSDPAGAVAGAFMHTPPFPVVLTAVAREAAAELAALTMAARPLGGVNAYPEVAAAFADGWRHRNSGGRVDVHRRQRLYRLAELVWPDPAPEGTARLACDLDVPLTAEWFAAFADEVGDMGRGEDQSAAAREKISHGGVTVWEAGAEPVSIACNTLPVTGMVRIGPVYTPPELRGHGYASAATAALSRRLLQAGAEEVVLYTDLANPVSNSIYQRIGYRPVEDRVVLGFSAD
jgi:RimJ/RimL family protein N-acetyltransferase